MEAANFERSESELDNLIQLDEQRALRASRKERKPEQQDTDQQQQQCVDGVCVVNWRPRRPAA